MTIWTELMTLPHELRFVDVGGVRTRSLVAGSGKPLILLHGISGHLETYIPVIAAHAEHFEVHAIDMLAHGFTGRPGGEYPTQRLAAHVVGYLDAIGAPKAHIAGISQGGFTAAYVAAEYPDRVDRLVLCCAVGGPALPIEQMSPLLAEQTNKAVFSNEPADTRTRLQLVVTKANHDMITDELVDIRFRVYQQPALREAMPGILAATRPEIYRRDSLTPERLAKVTAETLVIWSDEDPSGLAAGDYLRDTIARAKEVVFSGTGHWPPFERPADYVAVVNPFLQKGLDEVVEGMI